MQWHITSKFEEARVEKAMRDSTKPILRFKDRVRRAMMNFENTVVPKNGVKYSRLWKHQHKGRAGGSGSLKFLGGWCLQQPGERKEKISVALYPSTIRLLDEACRRESRSRSNLIEVILRRRLPKMMEEDPRAAPSSIDIR